jgi:hypothetical protein
MYIKERVLMKLHREAKRIPIFGNRIRNYLFKKRFETEKELIEGRDPSDSNHTSIIHLTLNRSASQWVKSVLKRCVKEENMLHVQWNEMAFCSDIPYLDHLEEVKKYGQIFKPKGYLYSAYGSYPKGIPSLESYKVILVVRDPRDILVSKYYSKKESHDSPPISGKKREKFMEERDFASKVSIDKFVLEKCNRIRSQYDEYIECLLEEYPNVYVTKYENMANDVESWLDHLLEYLELSPSQKLRSEIIGEALSIQSKEEDKKDHNRKGSPGDYKNKLTKSTINKLNKKFGKVIKKFDFNK